MSAYPIQALKRLQTAMPEDVVLPDLFVEFTKWLKGKPFGSVGSFEVEGGDASDLFPPRADIADQFGMVLRMGDGGQAGFWLKDTRDANEAPFVLMSSEGQFIALAPNFAGFLNRLVRQDFDLYDASGEFCVPEDVTSLAPELKKWLADQPDAMAQIKTDGVKDYTKYDKGRAQKWLDGCIASLEEEAKGDVHLAAISEILKRHRLISKVRNAKPPVFHVDYFRVFAAGDKMVVKGGAALEVTKGVNDLDDLKPAAEAELIPHLFAAREAYAKKKKGEGLWPSASLIVLGTGEIEIDPNYHHQFAIGYKSFPARLFAEDQARYPRKASKIQDWHKALIEKGST